MVVFDFLTKPLSLYIAHATVNSFTYCTIVYLYKQLMLLVVKKRDARLLHSCPKLRFVFEDMIQSSVRFPTFEASALQWASKQQLLVYL